MYPQRLPIVDSDDGVWGDILRKYLEKEHYNNDSDNAENGGHKNVTIRAGTAGSGGAPLKFTSGTLLTTPEIGAVEFAGDNLYLTQTSGTTRKKVALYDDASGATGDIYYRNGSGYFTRLAIGTASQILTISGGIPSWQTLSVPGSAVNGGSGSGLDADLLDGIDGNAYLRTDAARALTNINNLTYNSSTLSEVAPAITAVGSAPFGARIWHDLFAFMRNYTWTYETYDGSNWSTQPINKSLFAQKENQQIYIVNQNVTNPSQVRWTAQGVGWSQAKWLVIGFTYGATSASKIVTVETSVDGLAWTQRHQSTTTANAAVRYFYLADYGGDSYFRITITRNDTNRLAMSFMSLLTSRSGDQGNGKEIESPLDWDADRNITVAGSLQVISAADGANQAVTTTASQTLTSKRIAPRVVTITQSATPTIATDTGDIFIITGLAQAITGFTVTGAPVNGQRMRISVTGTASRAITWGTSFEASTKPLPSTTVSTNRLDIDFIWNATTSKWRVADEYTGLYTVGGTDVSVADGGTGRSTATTAYGIIAAGTTATGAQQTIAPGTTGQFLKSAGASALASFASITAADITGTTAQFNAALSDNDFATQAGNETLINKTINGNDNTISNIPWAGVSGKPAVIAAGASIGEALSNVNLTEIVGGSNTSNGRTLGAYARNALYSHPESQYFVPIPHAYNDIAYNNIRGGSVEIRVNGSVVAANGNNAGSAFGPDAAYEFADYYSSTSDTVVFEVTLHRTFQYGYCYGIQQADWFRGQNITFEAYNGSSWSTLSSVTNQTTGLTWNQADAGSTGITKLRITLTNFNSSTARITQIFLIGFNSDLLSGTFLPRGGGRLYGDLQAPGVRVDTIRDGDHGIGILDFYGLPSAVNYLQIQNRATGAGPGIYAQGADPNIDINLVPKGTGKVKINGADISSDVADGSITSAKIADGSIMNADVNASAGIAVSKLGTGRVDASVNGTATNTSIWRGTQAQYDAIGTKDSNTIYFITT